MNKNTERYFEALLRKYQNGENLTIGEDEICRFYKSSLRNKNEIFEINRIIYENRLLSLSKAIKESGLEFFIMTDRSTALMEMIFILEAEGIKMAGIDMLERLGDWDDEPEIIKGIRFEVK